MFPPHRLGQPAAPNMARHGQPSRGVQRTSFGGAVATSSATARAPAEGLFCNYAHRVCMQNRVDGHEFCIKHVLEDKKSHAFRQCNYMSQNGEKRCPNAAPVPTKVDKRNEGYDLYFNL